MASTELDHSKKINQSAITAPNYPYDDHINSHHLEHRPRT
jgi:hypothetical protein